MIPGSFLTPSPIIPQGGQIWPPRMESAKKSPAWNRVKYKFYLFFFYNSIFHIPHNVVFSFFWNSNQNHLDHDYHPFWLQNFLDYNMRLTKNHICSILDKIREKDVISDTPASNYKSNGSKISGKIGGIKSRK